MIKPHKMFSVMVLLFILSLCIVGGGIFLANRYLIKQVNNVGNLRTDDELLKNDLSNAQKIRDDLRKYSYLDKTSDDTLLGSKNQSEAILMINKMSRETHLNISAHIIRTTESESTEQTQSDSSINLPNISMAPISVNFRASYDQIISWLELVEKKQQSFKVEQINISPAFDDEGKLKNDLYDASIIINVYIRK